MDRIRTQLRIGNVTHGNATSTDLDLVRQPGMDHLAAPGGPSTKVAPATESSRARRVSGVSHSPPVRCRPPSVATCAQGALPGRRAHPAPPAARPRGTGSIRFRVPDTEGVRPASSRPSVPCGAAGPRFAHARQVRVLNHSVPSRCFPLASLRLDRFFSAMPSLLPVSPVTVVVYPPEVDPP
jgi:hypothetical protein